MTKYLSTSALAKATGVHPNTVRRYAARGVDWANLIAHLQNNTGIR